MKHKKMIFHPDRHLPARISRQSEPKLLLSGLRAGSRHTLLALVVVCMLSFLPFTALAQSSEADSFLLTINGQADDAEATQNQSFSMTVEALLATLETANDYAGSIQFTSSDTGATLPGETAFVTADNGIKDFDLAFKLIATGSQTITATDADDNSITGVITVNVVGSGDNGNESDTPAISIPANGTIVNTAIVDIAGTAKKLSEVSIFDGTEEIGTVTAENDGSFSFTTDSLFDGTHTFTAKITTGGTTLSSDPVRITVDTTSAVIREVELVPPSSGPGGTVAVTVETEENLKLVEVLVDQRSEELEEDTGSPGTYTGTIVAPLTEGTYPVDIRVTDESENTDTYEDQAELTVVDSEQPPTVTIAANPSGGIAPLNVAFTGVASDPDGFVKSYAWNFGDGGTSTVANPSHVYAQNGSYSVSLTVTDDEDLSATARLTTNIIVTTPPATTNQGPGTWVAVLIAVSASGITYRVFRRRKAVMS